MPRPRPLGRGPGYLGKTLTGTPRSLNMSTQHLYTVHATRDYVGTPTGLAVAVGRVRATYPEGALSRFTEHLRTKGHRGICTVRVYNPDGTQGCRITVTLGRPCDLYRERYGLV